ncbi:hypothetical protein ERO13_A05G235700v2 [Gossypium hirsutum]|uniref:Uncharacterized protein n=3 Tax=Gossypium TaxID=3633 RepID=A0A5J5VTW2_GOSBA|nr:hypothetical protein ES319_A05G243900v1 [Gossypium barbadense]KAG4200787.1 hypothetical protein ERO13_A05G235700v2 [Gossypium hirsutum]TYH18200.1 hypothetical protein ES288_A05G250800v1 [Gossypium darwinii]
MLSNSPYSPFLFSRKAHLKPSTAPQNLIATNKARPSSSGNTMQLRRSWSRGRVHDRGAWTRGLGVMCRRVDVRGAGHTGVVRGGAGVACMEAVTKAAVAQGTLALGFPENY